MKFLRAAILWLTTFFGLLDTGGGAIFAQSTGTSTLFSVQMLPTNPAVAGWQGVPTATLSARQQWLGFSGAPSTQVLSFHTSVFSKRLGLGVSVENDISGLQGFQAMTFGASYSVIKTQHFGFRMGLHGAVRRWRFDFSGFQNIPDLDDPALADFAPSSRALFNVGAGALVHYRQSWLGVSIPFALENEYGFAPQTPFTATEMRILQVAGGLVLPISERLSMRNAFCWKQPNSLVPWLIECNGNLVLDERVGAGVGYRASRNSLEKVGESISILASYAATDKLTIFAAYDIPMNQLSAYHNGSVEIAIRYDLKIAPVDLSNPRFR